MWHVLVSLHKEITISFLMVGHTKFSPDCCFGLFKQMYRKTKAGNIHDIVDVVKQSARVKHPQLIGDYDATIHVKSHDWSTFFDNHFIQTSLKCISKIQHFRFISDYPGYVYVRNTSDDKEHRLKLLKYLSWRLCKSALSEQRISPGLSLEFQWYPHHKIQGSKVLLWCWKRFDLLSTSNTIRNITSFTIKSQFSYIKINVILLYYIV